MVFSLNRPLGCISLEVVMWFCVFLPLATFLENYQTSRELSTRNRVVRVNFFLLKICIVIIKFLLLNFLGGILCKIYINIYFFLYSFNFWFPLNCLVLVVLSD